MHTTKHGGLDSHALCSVWGLSRGAGGATTHRGHFDSWGPWGLDSHALCSVWALCRGPGAATTHPGCVGMVGLKLLEAPTCMPFASFVRLLWGPSTATTDRHPFGTWVAEGPDLHAFRSAWGPC